MKALIMMSAFLISLQSCIGVKDKSQKETNLPERQEESKENDRSLPDSSANILTKEKEGRK